MLVHTPPSARATAVPTSGTGGGSNSTNDVDDSAANLTWVNVSSPHAPSARLALAMAPDPVDGSVLLFGGASRQGTLGDTWRFGHGVWQELHPLRSPPARYGASMAFDPSVGATILFGGEGTHGAMNDTWAFVGGNWVPLPEPVAPSPRLLSALTFDTESGALLLFGGAASPDDVTMMNDTWELRGGAWSELFPTASPPGRAEAGLADDPDDGFVVLFGGLNADPLLNDSWTFSHGQWSEGPTVGAPPGRQGSSVFYDPTNGVVLSFGGCCQRSDRLFADTWLFDPNGWENATATLGGTPPPGRALAGLSYSSLERCVVLFGGGAESLLNDTWVLTTQGPPSHPTFPGGAALALLLATPALLLLMAGWLRPRPTTGRGVPSDLGRRRSAGTEAEIGGGERGERGDVHALSEPLQGGQRL